MLLSKNHFTGLFFLFINLLLFSSCGSLLRTQAVKNYKPSKTITGDYNKYQYDLLYYNAILEDGFPYINDVFPEKERKIALQEAVDNLAGDQVENIDFTIQTSKYLSNFNNQHTRINLKSPTEKSFPFFIHMYKKEWYLLNISNEVDSTFIGEKITAINNIEIASIQEKLSGYTYAENETNKIDLIEKYALYQKPEMLVEVGVISSKNEGIKLDFENEDYAYLLPIKKEDVKMYQVVIPRKKIGAKSKEMYFYKCYPEKDFGYLQFNSCHDKIDFLDGINTYVKPWARSLVTGWASRQMKKKKPNKHIAGFYNPKHPIFREFVAGLVDSLNDKKINNLIIDLRYNPGGSVTLCKQLLYQMENKNDLIGFEKYTFNSKFSNEYFPDRIAFLKKKNPDIKENEAILVRSKQEAFRPITNKYSKYYIPPNRSTFKGNIYVLSDTGTGSAAAILTTLFQDNEMATVIGRTVGNNPIGATTYTPVSLPKTKASGTLASTYVERPKEEKGNLQQPDHWIDVSIEDLLNGRDRHIEKALELMNQ